MIENSPNKKIIDKIYDSKINEKDSGTKLKKGSKKEKKEERFKKI